MRKRIITLILSMLVVGFTQAQVLFDPANYVGLEMPNGMSIVDVDGTKYLKTTLDGWGSVLQVSPTVVKVAATSTKWKFKAKYAAKDATPLDSMKLFIQIIDTTGGWKSAGGSDANPSAELASFEQGFSIGQPIVIGKMQLASQYRAGSWPARVGDTLWLGKITAYDPNAVEDPDVLFDPAKLETIPAGAELVTEGTKSYLKVKVAGWNTSFAIPEKSTGDYNKVTVDLKYEQGTSPLVAANAQVLINLTAAGKNLVTVTQNPATTDFATVTTDATSGLTVSGMQVAVQDTKDPDWAATTDAFVYIGKMVMSYVEPEKAVPPITGVLNFTTEEVVIDDQYDNAFEGSAETFAIKQVATGKVDGTAAAAGATVNMNNDSYAEVLMVADMKNLYFYVEVSDNDPIDLGTSTNPWNNDGMEIFIDVKDRRYVGGKRAEGQHHQLRVNYEKGKVSGWQQSDTSTNDTIKMKTAVVKSSTGYSMEIAIPWSLVYLNSTITNAEAVALVTDPIQGLKENKTIALEMSILDAEKVDVRKSILNWSNNTGTDVAYQTTEYWGQLTLKGGFPVSVGSSKEVTKFNVYPNPTTGELTLDLANVAKVEIYNVLGAKVQSVNMVDNKVDVSALSMGVYVVKATTVNGEVAVSKFNKK